MEEVVRIKADTDSEIYENVEEVDFNHENFELPNLDILYTFDNDIINEYYRRA